MTNEKSHPVFIDIVEFWKSVENPPPEVAEFLRFCNEAEELRRRGEIYVWDLVNSYAEEVFPPTDISRELLREWMRKPIKSGALFTKENETKGASIKNAWDRKFLYLFLYFNIPHGNWEELARAIALEFVPGLKVEDGKPLQKGAPIRWTDDALLELLRVVEETQAKETGLSSRQALNRLLHEDPVRWGYPEKMTSESKGSAIKSLANRLAEAKKLRAEYP